MLYNSTIKKYLETIEQTIREKELNVWDNLMTNKKVIKLDNVGHFPQEEATDIFIRELKARVSGLKISLALKRAYIR